MDKKNIRMNQISAKSSQTERKSQDVSIPKQWSRNSRRRESKSSTQSINDSPRKPQQKANFDKRAYKDVHGNGYQRSAGTSAFSSGTRLDEGDHIEAELNSVYLPGSKKQNLNHLLNFNYTPRENASTSETFQRNGYHRPQVGRSIKYNKEQFLQATCQFVIRSEIDKSVLSQHLKSPDHLIDWTFVEQVNVRSSEDLQCPICLYPPVAGKMTRCGHIYCWPCLLHYLAISDKSWRKCPLCDKTIHMGDLRSVTSKNDRVFNVGDYVELELMCRKKGSLKVVKFNNIKSEGFPHISGDADDILYSKLVLANPSEVMAIIERERNELNFQLGTVEQDSLESSFIQQSLDLLKEREKNTLAMMKNVNQKTPATSATELQIKFDKVSIAAEPCFPNPTNEATQEATVEPIAKLECEITSDEIDLLVYEADIAPAYSDSNYYYFYQSSNGQQLYLHSINFRMLQMMYSSLDRAPPSIKGKIVQKEVFSMSEELRKRLKYLEHLPMTSEFEIAELSFGNEVVSQEILDAFKDEIYKRKKMRQRRARDENRREIKINAANERQIGKLFERSANIDVNSDRQFPYCGSKSPLFNDRDDPPLHLLSNWSDTSPTASGPSFATMLTQPKKTELWPSLSPVSPKNGCSDSVNTPSSSAKKQINLTASSLSEEYVDNEVENAAGRPELKPIIRPTIAVAVKKQTFNQTNGKTKKKKRNTLLFSTGRPGHSKAPK